MNKQQIDYIQKYMHLCPDEIYDNSNTIDNLLFYKNEINLQQSSKNDLMFESYGDMFGIDKDLIRKSIYDRLNCRPVNNFEYPENKKFAVCLTHDVDDIYPPLSHTFISTAHCVKKLNAKELNQQISWKFKGMEKSPYLNFKEIIKLEEKYDAKSSFYFIATEKDPVRFRYNIEDIESELGFIVDSGWEVGLHGGYYAYNCFDTILKEKNRLEKVLGKDVIGYRNHYLRFDMLNTWELLAKAGFKYDTTFGYNDMVGFRNGMCHPFKPFNLNLNKEINILEIPLIVMDGALFSSCSSIEHAWDMTKNLIDTVEKYNGILTILWHNNVFNYPPKDAWRKFYERILAYVYQKDAWVTSGEDILKWWENDC